MGPWLRLGRRLGLLCIWLWLRLRLGRLGLGMALLGRLLGTLRLESVVVLPVWIWIRSLLVFPMAGL